MKELQEIVKAYDDATERGLKTALATVVHVEGSAYRHEGARMLVTENGELTGAISGGCLEGDALRKARLAIVESRNTLVTYDTTDDDDATMGVGLGCNGVIQVLLEPLNPGDEFNPIHLFRSYLAKRQEAVLGTFFSLQNKLAPQAGTSVLLTSDRGQQGFLDSAVKDAFLADAGKVLKCAESLIVNYHDTITGFIEYLKPPVHLLIFGAGNDAMPLVQFAHILGWEVSVIDGRANYATTNRFPSASQVLVSKPEHCLSGIVIDHWTVAVLMTHNYNYDIAALRQLSNFDLKYIGALGPKKKLQRMLDELQENEIPLSAEKLDIVFGPTGLDIGSETPEEIALSIVSEIKAVLSNRTGTSLKFRPAEQNAVELVSKKHPNAKFSSCAINL
ncbi:XdhC family protein [Paradesertivirga mongoliensis]|uniref:XdhC family protein n=1 Tax=Paradesertivirga mongoliensis TaxID=2100740 RepID=A0ABW4ZJD3_9SPHI|nr:XdhC/CoxI family protein [Pedobacter mongoliensis]